MKKAKSNLESKIQFKREMDRVLNVTESDRIWRTAEKRLKSIGKRYPNLPKGVKVHTERAIFPAAAIYLSLKEYDPKIAFEVMEKYMKEQSSKTGESLGKLGRIPGFKRLFLKMWDVMSHKMFSDSSGFQNTFYPKVKNEFRMDILECPYRKYLTELGCPEIIVLFCNNDIYAYGNIPGLEFIRTQTLGAGGEKCDFKLVIRK